MLEALPDLLLRHRHARALAIALNVLLGVLVLMVLAKFVWLLAGTGDTPRPAMAVAPLPSAPAESLARWHLFGNAAPSLDPRGQASSAPDTGLKLTLRGIFSQDDSKAGRAIIVDADGHEATYKVGDAIPGGATLDAVHVDRVTLVRGGVLEALRLPRPEDRAAQSPAPTRPGAPGAMSIAPGTPNPAGATTAPQPFVTAAVVMPNTIDWDAATAKLGVDTAQLARQVQVLPVIENGAFVGVRLSGGQSNPALAKLGLKPDDVVTEVNGIPLDNFSRAQAVADSLANASSVSVTVRRGGKLEQLSVNLQ